MNDASQQPAGPAAAEDAAAEAGRPFDPRLAGRRLLRTARAATLATLGPEGWPYASLASVATLPDGDPVLPLSTLAVHTQHLLADPRCSLLLSTAGAGDPLTHPRLTLVGRAMKATDAERSAWRARFLRRHPKAEIYVDFGDFSFWRIAIESARMIGGFGRIAMLGAADLATDTRGAEALVAAEERALDHMNADHAAALERYATELAGAPRGQWRISGLDPDGIDLFWRDEILRLDFPTRVTDPAALRQQLVRWAELPKPVLKRQLGPDQAPRHWQEHALDRATDAFLD